MNDDPPYPEIQRAADRRYEAEYARWRLTDPEGFAAAQAAGVGTALVYKDRRKSGCDDEERTQPEAISLPVLPGDPDPSEQSEERRFSAQESVLRVLHILTDSRHPSLRLATDCLLALINRQDGDLKTQAAIARKHGLTRAAVQKRLSDMRAGEYLGGLESYFFGGTKAASEQARTRALREHDFKRQQRCKLPQTPSLLSQLQSLKAA